MCNVQSIYVDSESDSWGFLCSFDKNHSFPHWV